MKYLAWLAMALSLFGVNGCNTDPCKGIECGTHGDCNGDGICECEVGYQKDAFGSGGCEIKWSSKFLGTYSVQDICHGDSGFDTLFYTSVITEVNEQKVAFGTFNSFVDPVEAQVDSTNYYQLHINDHNGANTLFVGSGDMWASEDTLLVNFVVTFPDNTKDTCSATLIRQ